MRIQLTNTGKRYNREWIFRHMDYTFLPGKKYAITGANGSGKSTLLQVIAGAVSHSEGTIAMALKSQAIPEEEGFRQIALAAPYLELVEEMSALEFLSFHNRFKPLQKGIAEILEITRLTPAANKQIRYYSSGMKQRLKLAQAFFCSTPVLLLDEPTTNLDGEGIALYHQLVTGYAHGKMVIVSSNDQQEYHFCEEVINIAQYK